MYKLFVAIGLFFCVLIFSPPANAVSNNIIIYQVQTGATGVAGDASSEFVSLYNNSSTRVEVTNWQVMSNTNILASFTPSSINTKIYFEPYSFTTIASNTYKLPNGSSYVPSVFPSFSGNKIVGSSSAGVNLRLVDGNNIDVDSVSWTTDGASNTQLLQRKTISTSPLMLQDTDSYSDFDKVLQATAQIPSATSLTEETAVVDVCPNISGLDTIPPIGYMQDVDGNCYEDVCDNVSGLQKTVPNGYYKNGIDCAVVELKITELLPNVSGSDNGKEFVEIYNPTSYSVDLDGYILQLGPNYSNNYVLPSHLLAPGSYAVFSDTQTSMTMPNTSASVKLLTPDSQEVDETASYSDPKDDQSWALFVDSWQYTNQPTAQAVNSISLVAGMGSGGSEELAACPAGKYRNPETNRCRNIESDTGLKPCAPDQIRNPQTNRCRSIFASDSGLTPCKTGQTRNPETNRCRNNTSVASTLKPCAANQERNLETNRCRKKATSQTATVEVKDVESKMQVDRGGWLLAGTAGIGLASYGVAEWREEITLALRRFRSLLGKNPPTD